MKKLIFIPVLAALIIAFTGCSKDDDTVVMPPVIVVKPDLVFFGISSSNQLIKYNANAVQNVAAQFTITGLQTGENILAIDFRPATGQLYGLGNSSRIYVINPESGAARAIGTAAFTPALSGTVTAFDFNPTVDRIRVVTNTGQNLRLNPETGTVAATDMAINPAAVITGAAYTNSVAGAATTTLFDIDGQKLYKQDPPNNGALVEVGSLGISGMGSSDFDISPDNKVILAPITVAGVNNLYQVDTATGKATDLGTLATPIIGVAIPTRPVAYSTDNANNLLIFNLTSPGTPVTKPITGLQAGENILGMDMRPATGQLYALGSSSRIYTINMSSGAAVAVGTTPFTTLLAGTSFGFDFNPTVDRIRVVSNTGQNLRLDPNTGLIAAIDGNLNPGAPAVAAAAYTNNFAGATATTLFVIDPATDKLYMQNPPNNGTLVEVGPLGINAETDNGFDIGGTSSKAYALLTVGTTSKIYTINLSTGAAAAVADIPRLARGFAVGLGF
ncbi:DUF4394 domain-containing protein [Ferruginibacter profundus]